MHSLTTLARNKGYERIVAVATSAVREAKNGGEFLEEVLRHTGLTVRVVTGKEEARLIYLGVRHSMALAQNPSMVVDIGGGSVELIVGNRKTMVTVKPETGRDPSERFVSQTRPADQGDATHLQRAIDAQLKPAVSA